jgi:hypothetical protein
MGLSYGWQKLHEAVLGMAGSERSLRDRLVSAMQALNSLAPEDLGNEETLGRFQGLKEQLTRDPAEAAEGTIAATISKLEEEEVESCIAEIVGIYDDICRQYGVEQNTRQGC